MRKRARRMAALSLAAVGTLVLAACGGSGSGNTQSGATGSPGSGGGATVNVTLSNHPWTNVVKDKIADFEKESGLKVNVTVLGEDQLSDQYNVKLNAGASDIDVLMMRPLQEGKLFSSNGWLKDLKPLIDKAGSDYNWNDFQMQDSVTTDKGVIAVPIVTEQEILYFRKDLLQKANLQVPKTFDELKTAADTIQKQNQGVYGFVARGQRSAAVTQLSSFLYGFGGDWDNGQGKATIDTPEAKAAYDYYGSMLKQYGPPGVTNMSWKEASAIFQQGKAAFYTDASVFYNNMIDKTQSRVGDQVGYAQMPAGPAGSKPYSIPSWGLAINSKAKNVDGAWKFIQWATSPAMTKEIQAAGVAGARNSVWSDPAGTSAYPKELAEVLVASAKDGVGHDRPVVTQVGKARDMVGGPLIAVISGESLDAALKAAQADYQSLLDSEKK